MTSQTLPEIHITPVSGLPGPLQVAFDQLRPADLEELMRQARIRGIRLEQDPQIKATMARFWEEFRESQERYSPRTLIQLGSMWGQFAEWCNEKSLDSVPAELETVKRYLSQRAQDKHRNTLAMDRWAIGRVHRAMGCPDPTTDQSVTDFFAGLVRKKVMGEEMITQASPLRECNLDDLVGLWGESQSLSDRRDVAILVVAYETLLRASEVINIKMRHIKMNTDGTATLMIPITKTNKSGDPDYVALSRQAVRLIRQYMSHASRTIDLTSDEALFIGINNAGKSVKVAKPLGYVTIKRVFARAWEALGLNELGIPCYTAHSARVGAAQDLAATNKNALAIQQAGRWSSEVMVMRYCRSIFAEEGAMAIHRKDKR